MCWYIYIYIVHMVLLPLLICTSDQIVLWTEYEAWLCKRGGTRLEQNYSIFSLWLEYKCGNNSSMVPIFQWNRSSASGDSYTSCVGMERLGIISIILLCFPPTCIISIFLVNMKYLFSWQQENSMWCFEALKV